MSRWEVEMSDGSKRVIEAASENDALSMAAAPPAAPTGPDMTPLGDRLQSGMAHGSAGLMHLAAMGLDKADSAAASLPWFGHARPIESATGIDTNAIANAPWGQAADEAYRQRFGGEPPGPPRGLLQKMVGYMGGGLATPMPVAGSPVGALLEGAGLTAGSLAGAQADESGANPWVQAGASIAASAVPGGATGAIVRGGLKAEARAAANQAAESLALRSMSPESATSFISKSIGPDTMTKAASEFKTLIPQGYEGQAIERLAAVNRQFPNAATRPTTSQALDDLGGSQIEASTMSLDRGDRTISRALAGQKKRAVDAVDEELKTLRPEGDFQTAQAGYEAEEAAAKALEKAAWNKVPLELMPQVPTHTLKNAEAEIRASVGKAGASDIPGIFDVVRDYNGTEPFSELQSLRSKLLRIERAGASPMASEQSMGQRGMAIRLRQHVESLIDDVADNNQVSGAPLTPGTAATVQRQEGVEALREAHRITRENRELYSRKSQLVKAFDNPRESKDIATALLRGGPQDSKRALTMFRQNQPAQDSVKKLVMDEVIGPDILSEGSAKSAMKRLREKRETMVALFGAKHINNVEILLRKAKQVRSGRAGTRGAALGTGSNTLSSDAITKLETAMTRIGSRGAIARTANFANRHTFGRVKAALELEYESVLAAATIDTQLAEDLLRIPGPAALPEWANRMDKSLARNGIRVVTQAEQGGNP